MTEQLNKAPKWFVAFIAETNAENAPDFVKDFMARQQGAAQEDEERTNRVKEEMGVKESQSFEDELIDFIRNKEAGRRSYDAYFGNGTPDAPTPPPRNLTDMTLDEVLEWQTATRGEALSNAAGGYQIIRDTLRDAKRKLGLTGSERFSPELQDRIARDYLLRIKRSQQGQPTIDDFLSGKATKEEWVNALATEWAGLPVIAPTQRPTKQGPVPIRPGESYYKGVGSNRSLVDSSELQEYSNMFDIDTDFQTASFNIQGDN